MIPPRSLRKQGTHFPCYDVGRHMQTLVTFSLLAYCESENWAIKLILSRLETWFMMCITCVVHLHTQHIMGIVDKMDYTSEWKLPCFVILIFCVQCTCVSFAGRAVQNSISLLEVLYRILYRQHDSMLALCLWVIKSNKMGYWNSW